MEKGLRLLSVKMRLKEEKTVEDLLCRLLEVSELHGYSKDNRNTDIRHSVSNERHTDIRVFRWFITLFFYSFHLPLCLARWSNDLRMFLSSLLFFIIHLSIFFSLESSIQSSLLSTHPISYPVPGYIPGGFQFQRVPPPRLEYKDTWRLARIMRKC